MKDTCLATIVHLLPQFLCLFHMQSTHALLGNNSPEVSDISAQLVSGGTDCSLF